MSELSKGLGFTRDYSHATTQNEKAKLMIDQTAVSLGTNKLLRKVAMSSTSQAKLKAKQRQETSAKPARRRERSLGLDVTGLLLFQQPKILSMQASGQAKQDHGIRHDPHTSSETRNGLRTGLKLCQPIISKAQNTKLFIPFNLQGLGKNKQRQEKACVLTLNMTRTSQAISVSHLPSWSCLTFTSRVDDVRSYIPSFRVSQKFVISR